jgi:hypothetical protein
MALVGLFALGLVGGFFSAVVQPDRPHRHVAPVLYGASVTPDGTATCTAESLNVTRGVWVCTALSVVQPGQTVAPASDPGGRCGVRHVDQAAHAWLCDSVYPPRQSRLPPDLMPPPRSERITMPAVSSLTA